MQILKFFSQVQYLVKMSDLHSITGPAKMLFQSIISPLFGTYFGGTTQILAMLLLSQMHEPYKLCLVVKVTNQVFQGHNTAPDGVIKGKK